MSYSVAIIGEAWEAAFARATARSLTQWMPPGTNLLVPAELEQVVSDIIGPVLVLYPETPGFQSYADVRRRALRAVPENLLLIAAGTLPEQVRPVDLLGGSYCVPRAVEWVSSGSGTTSLHFKPPAHLPPHEPQHHVNRIGALSVWDVEGADRYFQALLQLEESGVSPIWKSYGPRKPVFVYNTNDFDEPMVSARECYVILASGLLGLRLVVESEPLAGAKVIVYDINPNQLAWMRHLLQADTPSFAKLVDLFRSKHADVELRQLQPHECANAQSQTDWYSQNHCRISSVAKNLEWEFVECDLLTQPDTLLRKLDSRHSTCFMYLDLFLVWNIGSKTPWVEHHIGMARSLETLVRTRIRGDLCFVPGIESKRFQLAPTSPFLRNAV